MRALIVACLCALTLLVPRVTDAGPLDLAKVLLHLKPHTATPCASPPTVPCTNYTTRGRTGISYDAYLVVADVMGFEGLGGVSCGIDYNPAPGSGADIYTWTLCADGFEWTNSGPNGDWPSAGSGNRITWTTCQRNSPGSHGIHAVAGVFYIYAYGDDRFKVTENLNLQSGPELKVANCVGTEAFLPAVYGGSVDFTPAATSPGYNPCNHPEPECVLAETGIPMGYLPLGGYKDVSFSIQHGGQGYFSYYPLQGTVTPTCPELTILSGGTYFLPAVNDKSYVQVRVAPLTAGPFECLLQLGATCRDVRFTGTGVVTPHPLFTPLAINELLQNGGSGLRPLEIQNIGSSTLNWETRIEYGSLDEIESNILDRSAYIQSLIPELTSDNGNVYDPSGNLLSTNVGGSTFNPGRGGSYFFSSLGDIEVMVADFVGVSQLSVTGSLKQHTGLETVDRFTVEWKNIAYDVIAHRTYGNPDYPSINHVFITADVDATYDYNPIISKEDATLSGIDHAPRVYHMMFMTRSGRDIDTQQMTRIAEAFIQVAHPLPEWVTLDLDPGDLAPGETAAGSLHLSSAGLQPGTYHARLVVPSNSLSAPAAILPVTIQSVIAPDIELSSLSVDFDSVFVGDQGLETLHVANTGAASLFLNAEVFSPDFWVWHADDTVEPGTSGKVIVRCSPNDLGPRSATLTVSSNDPDEATLQLPLSAYAPPRPEMSYSPASIVGTALPGGATQRTLEINNAGPTRLVFTAGSEAPWISVSPAGGSLAPGTAATLSVFLNAGSLGSGDVESTLVLQSNAEQNRVEIPVTFHVSGLDAASVEVDPGTLNPASRGRWVTAVIELPSGDLPEEIVLETVRAQLTVPADPEEYQIGDLDLDGIPDVRFRFDRAAFIRSLPPEDRVEVLVTGEIRNRHYFTARDSVRVLRPHVLYPKGGERLVSGAFVDARFDLDETEDADSITVSYSPDSGANWEVVGVTQGAGRLALRLPDEPSDQCLVAVHAYHSGVLVGYDRSDDVFSVSRSTGMEPDFESRGPGLLQNSPNPFTSTTRIPFTLAVPEEGRIEVINVAGMRVRTLAHGRLNSGPQEVHWDARDERGARVPPGLYVVRLRTTTVDMSRRMFLVP